MAGRAGDAGSDPRLRYVLVSPICSYSKTHVILVTSVNDNIAYEISGDYTSVIAETNNFGPHSTMAANTQKVYLQLVQIREWFLLLARRQQRNRPGHLRLHPV